jgi:glutamine synthetase
MTKDILFNNSNTLYDLRYQAIFDETPQQSPKQLTFNTKAGTDSPKPSPNIPPIPPAGSTTQPATSGPVDPRSGSPYEPPSFPPPPRVPQVYDNQLFDNFIKQNSSVRFVYVQWLDYMAIMHTRIVPIKEFTRMIREGDRISVSQSNAGILQNNPSIPTQIYIEPDLRSLRRTHDEDPLPSATVLSYWRSESGIPLPFCPRTSLESLINTLQYTHSTTLLLGFEIRVTFVSRGTGSNSYFPFLPLPKSSSNPPPFVSSILLALDATDIQIQSFHVTESPQAQHVKQHVFHLAPQPPLLAIDALLQARHTITQIAAQHDVHATLHPATFGSSEGTKPSPGTLRISLHPPEHDMSFFLGGVLAHLPSICAFSTSNGAPSSWVAWGTHNRAVPLCRVKPGHWDLSCFDGTANVYFGVAAIIAAGLLGLQAGEVQAWEEGDLEVDPEVLSEEERARYGVRMKMPGDARQAMEAVKGDAGLVEVLGHEVVEGYMGSREREVKLLAGMDENQRREYLIERY